MIVQQSRQGDGVACVLPSSFRDPNGFVFQRDGEIFRQVNICARESFDEFRRSGLYHALTYNHLLVSHEEVDRRFAWADDAYVVLKPERVPMITYPYEWSFSELQDAAITTLHIARAALAHSMLLRDASAYNIQFFRGKPIAIDTLSFEQYRPGVPWIAYRQFCQHFLAPLALMSLCDVRLGQLLRVYIDGIPLNLAAALLPLRAKFRPGLLLHLFGHACAQQKCAHAPRSTNPVHGHFTMRSFIGLLDHLEATIRHLHWSPVGTEWAEYDVQGSYNHDALARKRALIEQFLIAIRPSTVWDLGANTGVFSRIASAHGAETFAFDVDPGAVERNYLAVRRDGDEHLLPLLLDCTNPSPSLGWAHRERESIVARGPVDCVLALALVHHLAIGNNVPLTRIAEFLRTITRSLIIEFVSKEDSRVQQLLRFRADIFHSYTQEGFERAFHTYFVTERVERLGTSSRILYMMRVR